MSADGTVPAPITPTYDPNLVCWWFIRNLIKEAQERGQEEKLTRHLVGAALHLAFPDAVVDEPSGQVEGENGLLGDYLLGDTVFHVILVPIMSVYDRCRENIAQGFQVFLLVTDKYFCGTRQNAEIILPGKIMVASIENFICQTLGWLAGFKKTQIEEMIRQLLRAHNARVARLDADQALIIKLPPSLGG